MDFRKMSYHKDNHRYWQFNTFLSGDNLPYVDFTSKMWGARLKEHMKQVTGEALDLSRFGIKDLIKLNRKHSRY